MSITSPSDSSAPRKLCLTVDYEIFGNGSGDVRKHITEPTERMCRIAEKFGMPVTVFFELEEYRLFARHREELTRQLGYDPAEEMRRQAAELVRRGHDIQLHLHPQWYGAELVAGEWCLHHDRLTVDSLFETQEETTAFIKARKEELKSISGKAVTCYRAGGFAAQPAERLLRALAATGFVIESSVVKGLHRQRPCPLDFRGAPRLRRAWRISNEVTEEDAQGPLWEIPVYSKMGRRWHQLSLNRLKAKFSRHVPKSRQQEMMSQLGVKKGIRGILSLLRQPVPIKLDYHNLGAEELLRMIRRAPNPPTGDPDILVLIGHTKEHVKDAPFEEFLRRVSFDRQLQVVSLGELAASGMPSTAPACTNISATHCLVPVHVCS